MASSVTTMRLAVLTLLVCFVLPPAVSGQDSQETLQGDFAVTIASEDVPPDLIDGSSLIGRWQVTFAADGTYRLGRQDVGALVTGQFATDGDRLTLRAETGVLACVAEYEGEAAATYTWEVTGDRLQLIAVEEPCARRRLLLTTRTLSTFAACPALQREDPDSSAGTPTVGAGSPERGNPVQSVNDGQASPETEIDDVLRQMSDCWATREPDRFLQLLSREFREAQFPTDEDGLRGFTLAMAAPIVWDRVSEVTLLDDSRATAIVRQTSGDNIDEIPYEFVFEDGAWRWDGAVDSPDGG